MGFTEHQPGQEIWCVAERVNIQLMIAKKGTVRGKLQILDLVADPLGSIPKNRGISMAARYLFCV